MNSLKRNLKSQLPTTKINGKTVKPMYVGSQITNRTNKNLWVTFDANNPSNTYVFSMVYNRDTVRNATAKILGTNIQSIRSQRVKTYRTNS